MPAPIPDATRAAILNDIKAGTNSCRGIARDHGVSDATVRNIAKAAGITDAFSREHTEKATRARQADNRSRRVALAAQALDDADRMRQKAIASETGRDARDFATAYGIFVDKHIALERVDSDGGAGNARSMLGALAEGLQAAYEQLGHTNDEP